MFRVIRTDYHAGRIFIPHRTQPEELVVLIEDIHVYGKSRSAARVDGELIDWFQIKVHSISIYIKVWLPRKINIVFRGT